MRLSLGLFQVRRDEKSLKLLFPNSERTRTKMLKTKADIIRLVNFGKPALSGMQQGIRFHREFLIYIISYESAPGILEVFRILPKR